MHRTRRFASLLRAKRLALLLAVFLGALLLHAPVCPPDALAQAGIITTVAGTGRAGFNGDGIAATSAQLNNPLGVALDAAGNLFIADRGNERIRKIAAGTGIITTVAGTGVAGFSGDGGAATRAQLNQPAGVAVDGSGNLFIAEFANNRIRKVAGVAAGAGGTPPPFPPPPPLPRELPPIDPGRAVPQVIPVQITVFSTDGTVPGTNRTVRSEIIEVVERVSGLTGFQLTQDPGTGVANLNLPGGPSFSFLPITFRAPGQALRRQADPVVECAASGTVRITTSTGAQVEVMGIPPNLQAFVELMQQFDAQARVQLVPGQLIVNTPNNQSFTQISLRADFAVTPGAGAARIDPQPDGSVRLTYGINGAAQSQRVAPVFSDCAGFLETARRFAGVTQAVPLADGRVQVTVGGETLNVRPDFTVTRSPAGSKRILAEGEGFVFETGDGRRQRFTIVP